MNQNKFKSDIKNRDDINVTKNYNDIDVIIIFFNNEKKQNKIIKTKSKFVFNFYVDLYRDKYR